jgi:hypothetical protein
MPILYEQKTTWKKFRNSYTRSALSHVQWMQEAQPTEVNFALQLNVDVNSAGPLYRFM